MPIFADFNNLGTKADGTGASEYCVFCLENGDFTNPQRTMEEVIASSIENMTSDLQMPREQTAGLANSFIPTLKRWQK